MYSRALTWLLAPVCTLLLVAAAGVASTQAQQQQQQQQQQQDERVQPAAQSNDLSLQRPQWALNATAIEACSCPMFCPCYFSTEPAGHAGHGDDGDTKHFCLFNMAYRVNKGHAGETELDGAKFWISGDLGESWSDGEMEWALVRFDPSVTPEQRQGILAALPHLFPAKWKRFEVGKDAIIEWTADTNRAVAKLDGGKAAEITLNRVSQSNTSGPVVITNLKYWGAPRNDGFVLMASERHATHQTPEGVKPYEFEGSNGFMITIDINADDAAKAAATAEESGGMEPAKHAPGEKTGSGAHGRGTHGDGH